jgi:hypothetical protein
MSPSGQQLLTQTRGDSSNRRRAGPGDSPLPMPGCSPGQAGQPVRPGDLVVPKGDQFPACFREAMLSGLHSDSWAVGYQAHHRILPRGEPSRQPSASRRWSHHHDHELVLVGRVVPVQREIAAHQRADGRDSVSERPPIRTESSQEDGSARRAWMHGYTGSARKIQLPGITQGRW